MNVKEIIQNFQTAGAFFDEPTATAELLNEQEGKLQFKFPAAYREAVESGSYDKATFHFMEPVRYAKDERFLIFALWNDIQFAFATHEQDGDDFRIYPIGDVIENETTYANFTAWFEMVLKMSTRPSNPD